MTSDLTEITGIGEDDTGLIARITTLLFDYGINIEDLDQAVQQGVFRMTMHVDAAEMEGTREELRADLKELGEDLNLDVQVRFPGDQTTHNVAVIVTQHAFNVPEEAYHGDPAEDMQKAVAALERRGQPLEAEVLLEAIRMHLHDDVVVRRGRSHLRNGAKEYQLGLPDSFTEELPSEPVDSYSRHARRQSSEQK